MGCFLTLTTGATLEKTCLFHDFVAEFLNHRVRQDFLGHSLDLFFCSFAGHAVQIEHEKFALADVPNLAKPQRRKGMLYSLPLRIKNRTFRHHPHMCFHRRHYTKPSAATPE